MDITTLSSNLIIAASKGATDFLEKTAIGSVITALLAAVGVIVVILAVVRAVGKISQGKVPDAVKGIVGAGLLAVFLFQPTLVVSLVDMMANLVQAVIGSGDKLITDNCSGADGDFCK
jgi:hydrogenase-4 membrane subunit HyfE